MARRAAICLGIRCCHALRLGFWLDWARHTCSGRSAETASGRGFYRYVRNPMYLGSALGWIGLWVVFGHANPWAIAAVTAVALGVHLFVVLYEEPTLRRKFGVDYEAYCRNVSRWWPRLKGWDKPK